MSTNLYDSLESVIKLTKLLFNICGFNIFSTTITENFWKKRVRMIPTIITALCPVFAMLAFVENMQDYIKTVEVIFAFSVGVQVCSRRWILQSVHDDVIKCIDKCKIFRTTYAEDIQNACATFKLNTIIARPLLVIRVVLLLYLMYVVAFSFVPLLRSDRSLPILIYLPIGSPFEFPFYELNYVFVEIYLLICALFLVGTDAILLCFLLEISLQMNVIKYKLLTLGDDEEDDQYCKLREIYELHCEISRLFKHLKKIYSKTLLVQFATSFLLISTALFIITKKYYIFIFAFVGATLQLGIYCLSGEVIKDKFEKLLFTLYDNQWYKLNTREKKSLIIMMSTGQATPTLKAVGCVELSLNTYFMILKAAYTYLAVM